MRLKDCGNQYEKFSIETVLVRGKTFKCAPSI